MKKQILFLFAVMTVVTLVTGCIPYEPRVFGISESRWNTLTHEQQQEVIRGYNERKNTEVQVEPLNRAVGVANNYLYRERPRTRYVSVPVVRERSRTTTLISTPRPAPIIKKTKVVNVNRVVNVHNDNGRRAPRRKATTHNSWQTSKKKTKSVKNNQSSTVSRKKKKKRAPMSVQENPYSMPTSTWNGGKTVERKAYGGTTTR